MSVGDRLDSFDLPAAARRSVLEQLAAVLASLENVIVGFAFGSFVRGERFRDLDIAILFDEPMTFRDPGRVAHAIESNLSVDFPVDVVPLNDAPASFRYRVAQEGHVLREREPRGAIDFWVRARSEMLDLAEWHRIHGVV